MCTRSPKPWVQRAAFAIMLAGYGPHALSQTVGDAIPLEDPVYGDFGTVWVQRFGTHLDVPDVTADGAVTNADVIQWLRAEVWNIHLIRPINEIEGVDEDNVPPCQQAALALADFLRLISGDVTLDGIVDSSDVALMLEVLGDILQNPSMGSAYGIVTRYDVNQDDVVDQQDLVSITGSLGTNLQQDPISLAQSVVIGLPECGGGGPPPSEWQGHYRHPTHAVVFSDEYPTHDRSVSGTLWPRWFPNDHSAGVSLTWPLRKGAPPEEQAFPDHGVYRSEIFPPNHYFFASQNWPEDSSTHSVESSRDWPPNHGGNISAEWYPNPALLPPSVLPHVVNVSTQWDPNHRPADSREIQQHTTSTSDISNRSPHLSAWSTSWTHTTAPSANVFPPNHVGSFSIGWNHSYSISLSWPAGHSQSPSSGWPQQNDPRWPPNHFEASSTNTLQPGQNPPLVPPGIFPPDHSVWTTAIELLP